MKNTMEYKGYVGNVEFSEEDDKRENPFKILEKLKK